MHSALRNLASLFLTSSHGTFRPSLSGRVAFLQFFRSCWCLCTSKVIAFSLLPLPLGAVPCLGITSLNLFLQIWHMMFPNRLSLVSKPQCNLSSGFWLGQYPDCAMSVLRFTWAAWACSFFLVTWSLLLVVGALVEGQPPPRGFLPLFRLCFQKRLVC